MLLLHFLPFSWSRSRCHRNIPSLQLLKIVKVTLTHLFSVYNFQQLQMFHPKYVQYILISILTRHQILKARKVEKKRLAEQSCRIKNKNLHHAKCDGCCVTKHLDSHLRGRRAKGIQRNIELATGLEHKNYLGPPQRQFPTVRSMYVILTADHIAVTLVFKHLAAHWQVTGILFWLPAKPPCQITFQPSFRQP